MKSFPEMYDKDQFTKFISLKNHKGEYKVEERLFNNQKHFDRWYDKVTGKGVKIIGIFDGKHYISKWNKITDEDFLHIAKLESESKRLDERINWFVKRTDNGDFIQYLADNSTYHIIMHRDSLLTKWSSDRIQRAFLNFEAIEKFIAHEHTN